MVAERLQAATSNLTPPFVVVDLEALHANAASMITRANGLPIRLATKSIRCRAIINRMLARVGYQGVLAYSLTEAIGLASSGVAMYCWPIRRSTTMPMLILLVMINCENQS
jgi:D-serine deaminase-like pyridoxal phosphate-dependent protein